MDGRHRAAYAVIILFGIVSLFGDIIYEGARSVSGPYLHLLGAGALAVGVVAGLGEFLGYALRLVSGYLADTTRHYWAITFIGYGMLAAVPLLALAGSLFLILERVGKGIRVPVRDAILANATATVGRGWGFAVHEVLDQIGAIIGPLIFTAVFLARGDYRNGFALLTVPFALMLLTLFFARRRMPEPALFEDSRPTHRVNTLPGSLLPYGVFTALTMAGFAAFPIIAYHFAVTGTVSEAEIPLIYAVAMGVDAVAALAIGRTYDRFGLVTLLSVPLLAIGIPFLAFGTDRALAFVAVVLWGAAMGAQETLLRAAVADYTHISKRGTAYGIFNTVYGAAWFVGSAFIGWAYTVAIPLVVGFLVVMQVGALAAFARVRRGFAAPA
ncbi:MFS transporter [Methanoculleus palmolei]|jgi:MFS family permease|uniref:MFS transporter n=1 Tax=Methanoculleus palmolei TaxID=72612 RepID=A0ABD8A679_9EURY|nr:MFS transporter [Methanoculleus palmolei]